MPKNGYNDLCFISSGVEDQIPFCSFGIFLHRLLCTTNWHGDETTKNLLKTDSKKPQSLESVIDLTVSK